MKIFNIFLPVLLLLTSSLISPLIATQRHVPGQYAKISLAVAAASAGDTIIVAPGYNNIEDTTITINKRLTITGGGYRQLHNGGTYTNKGFIFTAAASNSVLSNFRLINPTGSAFITIENGCNNILISQVQFKTTMTNIWGISAGNGNRLTIRNCIFQNAGIYLNQTDKVTISNNVIASGTQSGNEIAIYSASAANLKIYNNLIGEISGYCLYYSSGSTISSDIITGNIFYNSSHIANTTSSALLYAHNRKWNVTGTEPAGGIDITTGDPLFIRFNSGAGFVYEDSSSIDSDVRLATSPSPSPCIDAGYPAITPMDYTYIDRTGSGGLGNSRVDLGIFGGPTPSVSPFTAPTVPTVNSLTIIPGQVSPSGTITIYVTGSIGSQQNIIEIQNTGVLKNNE